MRHVLTKAGYCNITRLNNIHLFPDDFDSSTVSFYHPDTPISLNMMATPCLPSQSSERDIIEDIVIYEIMDYIPDIYVDNTVIYPEYNITSGDFYYIDSNSNIVNIFNYYTGMTYKKGGV